MCLQSTQNSPNETLGLLIQAAAKQLDTDCKTASPSAISAVQMIPQNDSM